MNIINYINKKFDRLQYNDPGIYCAFDDQLLYNLEKAVIKLSNKNGLIFNGFFIDADDRYTNDLSQSLPRNPSDYYHYETQTGRNNAAQYGMYCHIINKDININDICAEINHISQISGEICVSDIYDQQFTCRKNVIGLILQGKPTATFDCDCWSSIDKKTGRRYATELNGNARRSESWIIPSNCKIIAVVCSDNMYQYVKDCKFDIWPITAINNND